MDALPLPYVIAPKMRGPLLSDRIGLELRLDPAVDPHEQSGQQPGQPRKLEPRGRGLRHIEDFRLERPLQRCCEIAHRIGQRNLLKAESIQLGLLTY